MATSPLTSTGKSVQTVPKITSGRHVCAMYTPLNPTLYCKTGECRVHVYLFFLIFGPKHRLLVLVRIASARRFQPVPTIYDLSKKKEKISLFFFQLIFFYFFLLKKKISVYGTAWASFRDNIHLRVVSHSSSNKLLYDPPIED